MSARLIATCVLLAGFIITSQHVLAGGNGNVATMAKIIMHLNHFPSSSEKNDLKKIVSSSSSEHEKTIAQAMINLHHSASSADKKKLKMIMSDGSASAALKDLAGIIYNLNHKPSSSDKQKLAAIAN